MLVWVCSPDMPVLCTHAHAWPLYSMVRMAGLTFDKHGLRFAPAVPLTVGPYAFNTPLASVTREHRVGGSDRRLMYVYTGVWSPAEFVEGCAVSVDIGVLHSSGGGGSSGATLEVRGEASDDDDDGVAFADVGGDGLARATFHAGCGPAAPLRWVLSVPASA